jgi:hypothetical protein
MTIFDAIRAAEANVHLQARHDPVSHNISVALLHIAQALRSLKSDVEVIEKIVKKLK